MKLRAEYNVPMPLIRIKHEDTLKEMIERLGPGGSFLYYHPTSPIATAYKLGCRVVVKRDSGQYRVWKRFDE